MFSKKSSPESLRRSYAGKRVQVRFGSVYIWASAGRKTHLSREMKYFCVDMTFLSHRNIPPRWDEMIYKHGVFEIFFVIVEQTVLL
jgi:hypothetical protein